MYDGFTIIIIILVILIIGVVLDGIRRARNSRRENITLSRNVKRADESDMGRTSPNSEFPSGGARIVAYRNEECAEDLTRELKESYSSTRVTLGAQGRLPEQVALKLNESVPMLMESVEEQSRVEDGASHHSDGEYDDHDVSGHGEYSNFEDNGFENNSFENNDSKGNDIEPNSVDSDEFGHNELDNDSVLIKEGDGVSYQHVDEGFTGTQEYAQNYVVDEYTKSDTRGSDSGKYQDPTLGSLDYLDDEIGHRSDEVNSSKPEAIADKKVARSSKNTEAVAIEEPQWQEPDEVIVFNLMAKPGCQFGGRALLGALMQEGLKLGEMDIFHRYYEDDGDAAVLFSLANMVVPGTFNLSQMDDFATPGVSMFLSLPIESDSISAYENLVKTATNLAVYLDGDLKDESRSVLTKQNIDHARQRVIEYERKRKLSRV